MTALHAISFTFQGMTLVTAQQLPISLHSTTLVTALWTGLSILAPAPMQSELRCLQFCSCPCEIFLRGLSAGGAFIDVGVCSEM